MTMRNIDFTMPALGSARGSACSYGGSSLRGGVSTGETSSGSSSASPNPPRGGGATGASSREGEPATVFVHIYTDSCN